MADETAVVEAAPAAPTESVTATVADNQAQPVTETTEGSAPVAADTTPDDPLADVRERLKDPEVRKRLVDEELKADIEDRERRAEERGRQTEFTKRQQERAEEYSRQQFAQRQQVIDQLDAMTAYERAEVFENRPELAALWGQAGMDRRDAPVRQAEAQARQQMLISVASADMFKDVGETAQRTIGMAFAAARDSGDWEAPVKAMNDAFSAHIKAVTDAAVEKEAGAIADRLFAQRLADMKVEGREFAPRFEATNGSAGPASEGSDQERLESVANLLGYEPRSAAAAVLTRR